MGVWETERIVNGSARSLRWLVVQVPTVLIGHPQRMTVASGFWTCGRPFVVLPCNLCNSPVEIESTPDLKHNRVGCPNCGTGTPEVIGGWLLDRLNEMVGADA